MSSTSVITGSLLWLLLLPLIRAEVLLLRRAENSSRSSRIELSCLYNGPQSESVGLSWVLPAYSRPLTKVNERWKHATNQPGLLKGHFEYYGHIWLARSSLQVQAPNPFPPVFDERWNDFPELYTDGVSKIFARAVEFSTDRVHVSVLARSDAHLVLHESASPYLSGAYWIALDQRGGEEAAHSSAIRKCVHGVPRSLLPRLPDCQLIRNGHKGTRLLQNGEEWVHLTLQMSRSSGSLTLTVSVTNQRDPALQRLLSLEWTDTTPLRSLRFLSVRTEDTPGIWKVHDYRLIMHSGVSDGEGFNVFQLSTMFRCCLHLYYYFEPGHGDAVIVSKDGNQTMSLQPKSNEWQMLKVQMDMKPPVDHVHFKPPIGSFPRSIFAISQPFKICGSQEFFVTKIVAEPERLVGAKCIDIKTLKYAQLQNSTSLSSVLSVCPNNKFSKSCNITCGRVVGDYTCRGKVACDDSACSCLTGYKPTQLWNTTCVEEIASDVVTLPPAAGGNSTGISNNLYSEIASDVVTLPPAAGGNSTGAAVAPTAAVEEEEDEIVSDEDEAEDVDSGEEGPDPGAEAAERSVCESSDGGGRGVAVIVLSLLLVSVVVCVAGLAWYWRRSWTGGRGQPFDVRWNGAAGGQNNGLLDHDGGDNL